jgi:hypothetical protein
MRADIVAGAVFPDCELTDHAGKRHTLLELLGPAPVILVLSLGGYRPKDLRQAEGLVRLYREMAVGYSRRGGQVVEDIQLRSGRAQSSRPASTMPRASRVLVRSCCGPRRVSSSTRSGPPRP